MENPGISAQLEKEDAQLGGWGDVGSCSRPCVFLVSLKRFCRTGELLTLASEDRQHGSVLGTARGVSIPRVLVTCGVGWQKKQRLVRYFCEFGYLDLLGPMFSGHLNTFERI